MIIYLRIGFNKNKSFGDGKSHSLAKNSIESKKEELKSLLQTEKSTTRNARRHRVNALKGKHAVNNAERLLLSGGDVGVPWPFSVLINKLLQKNLDIKKEWAGKAEKLRIEADGTLGKIRASRQAQVRSVTQDLEFREPSRIFETDIEGLLSSEKQRLQFIIRKLDKAETSLKEATSEREQLEQEVQNLTEHMDGKPKVVITEDEKGHLKETDTGYRKALEKEKSITVLVQENKYLAERARLDYNNAVEETIREKETALLDPLIIEPPTHGIGKLILLINTFFEVIRKRFVETEITEIPEYDVSRYGELVRFTPIEGYDIVEQTFVSSPYVIVTIINNKRTHKNLYYVSEPILNSFEEELLHRVNNALKIIILDVDIDLRSLDKELVLYKNYIKILELYGVELDPSSREKIWYYIKRNYVGYGKLDVLLNDPNLEDISCVGADVPIYLYHRRYTNIETMIVLEEVELDEMIMKLAQLSGKSISIGYPIMNARMPDGSRLEATLGREVTTRGGTITIRKFREKTLTPTDLIRYGTYTTEIMAYLWLAVENNKNILFVGETASGKTTTLNAISLFLPSESKIISIEDTREIMLRHNNWIPGVVRESFMGQEVAAIDMYELLRSALRQRPEYLIVGEIRGHEAYTLFQAMSTGHTTFSTMHAGSVQLTVNRLLNEPINVPLMMLNALDIMIIQALRYVDRKRVRRMESFTEFGGIDTTTGDISTQETYTWNPVKDRIENGGASKVLEDIMNSMGWSKEQFNNEMENRKIVLQYMVDNEINDYMDFSSIIQMYTSDLETVLNLIKEGKPLLEEGWA